MRSSGGNRLEENPGEEKWVIGNRRDLRSVKRRFLDP
jgi:hypothetical protein